MPCMFGLQPHQTQLADISRILKTHPYLIALEYSEGSLSSGKWYELSDRDHKITILLNQEDVVESITWGNNSCNPSWLPTVGELIDVLGAPSSVSVVNGTTYVYKDFRIEVESRRTTISSICNYKLDNTRLAPQDLVIGIFIESSTFSDRGKAWRGFQQAQLYFTQ
jgi:hypothetical protein